MVVQMKIKVFFTKLFYNFKKKYFVANNYRKLRLKSECEKKVRTLRFFLLPFFPLFNQANSIETQISFSMQTWREICNTVRLKSEFSDKSMNSEKKMLKS